jgi:hypothetical protein
MEMRREVSKWREAEALADTEVIRFRRASGLPIAPAQCRS